MKRNVSRVVEDWFSFSIKIGNFEYVGYEDECLFSHLYLFTPVSKMVNSSRLEVNNIDLSNV